MPEPKAPARKGGRNIPTYYYAIGAAGIAAAYFLYSRNKAKAAAAAATTPVAPTDNSGTAATPTAASAAGDQAVTQADLVSLLNSLQPVSTAEGTGAEADETHPIIEIIDPKTGKKTQVKTKPRPRAHATTEEITTPTVDTTPDVVPSVKTATPAKRETPAPVRPRREPTPTSGYSGNAATNERGLGRTIRNRREQAANNARRNK